MKTWLLVKIGFITLLCPLMALAQYESPRDALELSDEEKTPSLESINTKSEKYLRNESSFKSIDSDSGVYGDKVYTGNDRHKLLGAFLLQGNYEFLNQQQGLELTYMYKVPSWKNSWWGLTFRQTQTKFKHIASVPTNSTNPDSEAGAVRTNEDPQAITQIGIGGGYRFKLLLDFLPTHNVFETLDVFVTHNRQNDSDRDKLFEGFGFLADYSLIKRSGPSFFYGGKINYNLALVSRDPLGTEYRAERRLTLSWFSLGFVMGAFF